MYNNTKNKPIVVSLSVALAALFFASLSSAQSSNGQANKALRDPTQPLSYVAQSEQENPIILQAIFYGNGRKEAIVNGSVVKVGERVNGKKIVDIKANSISYTNGGRIKVLKLRQSIFEK